MFNPDLFDPTDWAKKAKNRNLWGKIDAFKGHRGKKNEFCFVDCESCRGCWGLFDGLLGRAGQALRADKRR